jgi:hypothetical protein
MTLDDLVKDLARLVGRLASKTTCLLLGHVPRNGFRIKRDVFGVFPVCDRCGEDLEDL